MVMHQFVFSKKVVRQLCFTLSCLQNTQQWSMDNDTNTYENANPKHDWIIQREPKHDSQNPWLMNRWKERQVEYDYNGRCQNCRFSFFMKHWKQATLWVAIAKNTGDNSKAFNPHDVSNKVNRFWSSPPSLLQCQTSEFQLCNAIDTSACKKYHIKSQLLQSPLAISQGCSTATKHQTTMSETWENPIPDNLSLKQPPKSSPMAHVSSHWSNIICTVPQCLGYDSTHGHG